MSHKRGIFDMLYSLGLLIVELEIARRRLRYLFEMPDGSPKGLADEIDQNCYEAMSPKKRPQQRRAYAPLFVVDITPTSPIRDSSL
jgi:hypothetical protein